MNIFKAIITLFFLTFWYSSSYGQDVLHQFEQLKIIDTIKSQQVIDQIKSKDAVKNSSFFFAQEYNKEKGLFLIEKKGNHWTVYNYDHFFISNYSINKHKTHSKRYVSIDIRVSRSGSGENRYGWFVLFDLEKRSYLVINTFSHNSDDDKDHKKYINIRECSSKIIYKNGMLIATRKCNPNGEMNYCSNCVESGEYKMVDDKLIKMKVSRKEF